MATAIVSRADFEAGRLPPVCARTGLPADELVDLDVVAMPSAGVLGAAVALGGFGGYLGATGGRVRGRVPMTHPAAWEQKLVPRMRLGALLIAAVALLLSLVEPVALAIAALMAVTYVVALVVGRRVEVRGVTSPDGATVTLTGVHERFAELASRGGRIG